MKTNWKITRKQNQHSAYVEVVVKVDKQQNKLLYYIGTVVAMLYEFLSKNNKYKALRKSNVLTTFLGDYKKLNLLQKVTVFSDKVLKSIEGLENEKITIENQLKELLKNSFTKCKKLGVLESDSNAKLDVITLIKLILTLLYFMLKLINSD